MDPIVTFEDLVKFLFGSAGLGAIAAGLLYVTRQAIATAVSQAGARELLSRKAELDAYAAEKAQAFTRELERERQEGARALERFKAELTLEAEVRREVAARANCQTWTPKKRNLRGPRRRTAGCSGEDGSVTASGDGTCTAGQCTPQQTSGSSCPARA